MEFVLVVISILLVAQFSKWMGDLHSLRKLHTVNYKIEQEPYYHIARILNYTSLGLLVYDIWKTYGSVYAFGFLICSKFLLQDILDF